MSIFGNWIDSQYDSARNFVGDLVNPGPGSSGVEPSDQYDSGQAFGTTSPVITGIDRPGDWHYNPTYEYWWDSSTDAPRLDTPWDAEQSVGIKREAAAQHGMTLRQWNDYNRYGKLPGGGGRGGRGGGGGRGRAIRYGEPSYQYSTQEMTQLKDRFHQQLEQLTGMSADQMGVGFDWFFPKWKGGWAQNDFQRYYRGLESFKAEYGGIHDEQSPDEYNVLARQLAQHSIKYRNGKLPTAEEVRKFIETTEVPY
jgi:hypothetical protein